MILEHFPEWRRRCDFTKERGLLDPQEEKGDLSPAEQWRGSSEKASDGSAVLAEEPEDGNFGAGEEHLRHVPLDKVGGTYGPPREQPPHWDQPFQIQGNLCLTSSCDRVHLTPPWVVGWGDPQGPPSLGLQAAPWQPQGSPGGSGRTSQSGGQHGAWAPLDGGKEEATLHDVLYGLG